MTSYIKIIGLGCVGFVLASCGGGGDNSAGTITSAAVTDSTVIVESSEKAVAGYTLGSVNMLSDICASTEPAGTQCRSLEVTCPNMPALQVSLRITEPTTGVTPRGTVIFSTGGGGTGYYAQPELFQSLQNEGFRIVDRAWSGAWYQDSGGIRKGACRYATLATWVHKNLHSGPAFCATGNSGGAAEVGHAVMTYGRGAILDHVMPTGGPAVARLDYACRGQSNQAWQDQCAAIIADGKAQGSWSTCTPSCTLSPNDGVCTALSATATEQDLLYDSVLAPDSVYSFTRTQMSFLEGTKDCQISPVMGVLFHSTVKSSKSFAFIQNTPHAVSSTTEGRNAMVGAIVNECIARH